MTRLFIIIGILFVLIGIAWPLLIKFGIGHLPGDIVIKKDHVIFYFPITTSIIVSVLISLLFLLFR